MLTVLSFWFSSLGSGFIPKPIFPGNALRQGHDGPTPCTATHANLESDTLMSDIERDFYAFTFDASGAITGIAEVDAEDGTLSPETISPNETYSKVGEYVVEVENDDGGAEWSIYSLDGVTGYWFSIAEGHGTLDLTDLAAAIAAYVPGEDDRDDIDDHNEGTGEDDEFSGDDGDDGDDTYVGNGGDDHLTYLGLSNTRVDLRISGAQDTGHGYDLIDGIDRVSSGSGDDDLTGDDDDNAFEGNGGDDSLEGGIGNDSLHGGDGDDDLDGGDDDDSVDGGVGHDHLHGGDGDDSLNGGSDDDTLNGSAGNDDVVGGTGNDSVSGSAGHDDLRGNDGDDDLHGGYGRDTIGGGTGDDSMNGSYGDDDLVGGRGDDTCSGGIGSDDVSGGAGNDSIGGGAGRDHLHGGSGVDWLLGGAGNDTLTGGAGKDRMIGGDGSDSFVFTSAGDATRGNTLDMIVDFTSGEDVIDLAALNLTYIGTSAFSDVAGELRFADARLGGVLQADLDGDGAYDFALRLRGVHSIDAATDLLL